MEPIAQHSQVRGADDAAEQGADEEGESEVASRRPEGRQVVGLDVGSTGSGKSVVYGKVSQQSIFLSKHIHQPRA